MGDYPLSRIYFMLHKERGSSSKRNKYVLHARRIVLDSHPNSQLKNVVTDYIVFQQSN